MKKIIYIVLSLILLLSTILFMPACGDGFEMVAQIDFTTNGEKITKNSTKSNYLFRSNERISETVFKEKYLAWYKEETGVDYGIIYDDDQEPRNLFFIQEKKYNEIKSKINSKTIYYIENVEQTHPHYYLAAKKFGDKEYTLFYHCTDECSSYCFVLVKIIDNQTLQIADKNGITTYTVSSYKITYFKIK